ncbi:MAG: helix-turn-helix transcriptional regulator [Patescibacteria group bacterium]
MTKVQKQFGLKLKKIRLKRGFTQELLADKAGLHFTYVGQAERGLRNITLETLWKFSKALRVKGGELLPF